MNYHFYIVVGEKIDLSEFDKHIMEIRDDAREIPSSEDVSITLYDKFELHSDDETAIVGHCVGKFFRGSTDKEKFLGMDLIEKYEEKKEDVEEALSNVDWLDGDVGIYTMISFQ